MTAIGSRVMLWKAMAAIVAVMALAAVVVVFGRASTSSETRARPAPAGAVVPSRLEVGRLALTGQLSESAIHAALVQRRAALEACHRPRLTLEAGARSELRARWIVGADGTASHVTLRGSGLLPDGDACLKAALEGLRLPAPPTGTVMVQAELAFVVL